jgi:hypothetical protein
MVDNINQIRSMVAVLADGHKAPFGRNLPVQSSAMRTIIVIFALALVTIAGEVFSDHELTSSEVAPAAVAAARAP